ncbi:MAG: PD40 domain-containing protein [Planctomycetes bacterium]|nr:PD40 domain-containing protein [Planctomycetota bacterium]
MPELRKVMLVLMFMSISLAGCMETVTGVFKTSPKENNQKNEEMEARAPMQRERDPVDPVVKSEVGMDYDPRAWIANEYHPGALPKLISAPSYKGITQQTFSDTGGDFNVHLNSDGTRMIYNTTRYSKNPEVCIQGITAKAVQLMTEDKMVDMMAKFSPDGSEIAWCSNRYGNYDILVQDAEAKPDSRPRQLTRSTDDDIHPTWSPDGKLLAFSRFNSMDGIWQLWVMNYNTRTLSYITEGLFPEFRPVMGKTSKGTPLYTLAYQRARRRDVPWYSIWAVDVQMGGHGAVEAVGNPQEIIADDKWAAINPAWNPTGDYLAFATVRKSTLSQWQARIYEADDIYVVKIDGTDLTQITKHSAPDWDPWWAKDPGDPEGPGRIYFCSKRRGVANIWSVKPMIPGLLVKEPMGR